MWFSSFTFKYIRKFSKEISTPNPISTIGGLKYWNRQIGWLFYRQVCLCWCICALSISTKRSVWSIVKYLSTKF